MAFSAWSWKKGTDYWDDFLPRRPGPPIFPLTKESGLKQFSISTFRFTVVSFATSSIKYTFPCPAEKTDLPCFCQSTEAERLSYSTITIPVCRISRIRWFFRPKKLNLSSLKLPTHARILQDAVISSLLAFCIGLKQETHPSWAGRIFYKTMDNP